MELTFVRHAQPVRQVNTDRVADPGLSDLGDWQVGRLADWLSHEGFDAVVASPKARAIETVRPAAERLGLDVVIFDDLDEIDRGSFAYYPTETLLTDGADYWKEIAAQNWEALGWDSPDEFQRRCESVYERLVADPLGERVLIGSHGGTIGAIVSHVLAMPRRMDFGLEYGSLTRIEVGEHQTRLRTLNETGHFDAVREGKLGPLRNGNTSGIR